MQRELGNRHTHILIFIVIDCTDFSSHTHFYLLVFLLTNKKLKSVSRMKRSNLFSNICHPSSFTLPLSPSFVYNFLFPLSLHFYFILLPFYAHKPPKDISSFRMLVEAYNKIRYRLQQ